MSRAVSLNVIVRSVDGKISPLVCVLLRMSLNTGNVREGVGCGARQRKGRSPQDRIVPPALTNGGLLPVAAVVPHVDPLSDVVSAMISSKLCVW